MEGADVSTLTRNQAIKVAFNAIYGNMLKDLYGIGEPWYLSIHHCPFIKLMVGGSNV
jgi:hypothetical protein